MQKRADEIRELLRQGLSRREIARRLGISSTRVQQIVGGEHLQVNLSVTDQGVVLSSSGMSADQLAARLRGALALVKIDVIERE